jgi:hypothetical protein
MSGLPSAVQRAIVDLSHFRVLASKRSHQASASRRWPAGSVAEMPGMEKAGLKWAPRHSSRSSAPLRISFATGNMSPRAFVNTTFWFVQLPVSLTAHRRQRSSIPHTSP